MKKVIITGSEGLIGSELSRHLKKNYSVMRLDLKLGHDLTNENFVKKWFKNNNANHLINCFAINDHIGKSIKTKSNLYKFSLQDFSKYLEINLISLFSVCREFARNNKTGSIINFSSTYAINSPNPKIYGGAHKDIGYSVSKAGVINMTKYLAVHLAPKIRVNCIIPGGVKHNQNLDFVKRYSNLTPMKRMMKKSELNGMVSYLCSKDSSYVTGSCFVIDGGYTIW